MLPRRAGAAEQRVDGGLVHGGTGFQRVGARRVGGQLRLQLGELERLGQIVCGPAVQRAPDRVEFTGRGDHDDPDTLTGGAQSLQHIQSGHVRQVHIQQDQLRMVIAHRVQRLAPGAGHPDDTETVDAFDEAPVDLGDHEVVVDDENVTHARPPEPSAAALRTPHHRPAGPIPPPSRRAER